MPSKSYSIHGLFPNTSTERSFVACGRPFDRPHVNIGRAVLAFFPGLAERNAGVVHDLQNGLLAETALIFVGDFVDKAHRVTTWLSQDNEQL